MLTLQMHLLVVMILMILQLIVRYAVCVISNLRFVKKEDSKVRSVHGNLVPHFFCIDHTIFY